MFPSYRIRFRRPIREPIHGNKQSGRRTQSAPIRKRRNPNAFGIRSIRNAADCAAMHGSNPISMSNLRISPRKQAVRQATAIRTHPKTAESRGPRTKTSQPPNRPRPRSRTKSNLGPRFQVQSTGAAPAANRHRPQPAGNSGIPRFVDHRRPTAQPGTHGFQCSPRPEADFGVRSPNQFTETGRPAAVAIRINPITAESRGPRNRYKSSHRQSPTSHADPIQSRGPISEPVHDGGPCGRQ